jgi:hypothetical protein
MIRSKIQTSLLTCTTASLLIVVLGSTALAQAPAAPAAPAGAAVPAVAAVGKPTVSPTLVATKDSQTLTTDVLGAKALLEELIVKRYAQDLATRVAKDSFNISARLDLALIPPEDVKAQEPIDDLMLGTLDPESLMKKYAGAQAGEYASGLLSQFRIAGVAVQVGLRTEMGEEQKTEVTNWLKQRLTLEFGTMGVSEVMFIKMPLVEGKLPTGPETFMDKLNRFQDLAGKAVLALALLLGALVWGLLASKGAKESGAGSNVDINMSGEKSTGSAADQESLQIVEKRKAEQAQIQNDIQETSQKIAASSDSVKPQLEALVRMWCQQGESGRLRLACFAEAIGQTLRSMPIPIDAVPDVTKMFMQMPNVNPKEKCEALQKAYWDVMAIINLGAEAMNQPFSYVGGLNVDTINNVLIEQNSKMKTLVTLFMPDDLRGRYLKNQSTETKRELLQAAAELSSIAAKDLQQADDSLSQKVNGSKGSSVDMVKLEMTIQKIVEGLTPMEELELLRGIQGTSVVTYKKSQASLAFLDQWTDEPLGKLISRSTVDELTTYLRIRPDQQERCLSLSPPMTARMLKDELSRTDILSDNDKNRLLSNLVNRIGQLREEKEIDLESIFANAKAEDGAASTKSTVATLRAS